MVEDEAEIKTLLIWSGNGDVYHAMVKERIKLEKEQAIRESQELFQKAIIAKKKQERLELQKDLALIVGVILLVSIPFIVLVQWGIGAGLWASGKNDPRIVYQTQKIK